MKIELKLFATFSPYMPEAAEKDSGFLEVPEGISIEDLIRTIGLPEDTEKIVFVNGVSAGTDEILHDSDRVGIFPPVGGG